MAERVTQQNGRPATFDPAVFLASVGLGRRIVTLKPKGIFFSKGNPAAYVFYIQTGRAKLTVVSGAGKEATITLLVAGDFVGEESVAAVAGLHMATAVAITACTALKISRAEMLRVMHETVEREYYKRTGIFPIMHTVVIRKDLLKQHPELAQTVYKALCDSKKAAMDGYAHWQDLQQYRHDVPVVQQADRRRSGNSRPGLVALRN